MADLTNTATYPNLDDIIEVQGSFPIGRQPGKFRVSTVDLEATPDPQGDLVLSDGIRTVTLPDCAIIDAQQERSPTGVSLVFTLVDRRWKWEFTTIDGEYNRPVDQTDIQWEKTPQQLAALLLDAMNETSYSVSNLPNDVRPHVKWRGDNAADQLHKLCTDLGCEIAFNSSGNVSICVIGVGSSITPPTGLQKNFGYSIDRAIVPDSLRANAGNVQFEVWFTLEAAAEETDGEVVPMDKVSYKPVGGWENETPDVLKGVTGTYTKDGKTLQIRSWARERIWKMFRIRSVVGGTGGKEGELATRTSDTEGILDMDSGHGIVTGDVIDIQWDEGRRDQVIVTDVTGDNVTIEGGEGTVLPSTSTEILVNPLEPPGWADLGIGSITSINAFLPLLNKRNSVYTSGGRKHELRAELTGIYLADSQVGKKVDKNTVVDRSWRLDEKRGVVRFDDPIYRGEVELLHAALRLKCVAHIDHSTLNTKTYYALTRSTGFSNGTGPAMKDFTDVVPKVTPTYTADDVVDDVGDNKTACDTTLNKYLDQMEAEYVSWPTASIELTGIHPYALDGLRREIRWSLSSTGPSRTLIGLNARTNKWAEGLKKQREETLKRIAAAEANKGKFTQEGDSSSTGKGQVTSGF